MRLFAAVLLLCGAAAGQEDPPKQAPVKEKVIVVEAESPLNAPDVFDAKYSADVIGRQRLQGELQSRTFPETLEELPGVHIQKTGPGQGSPVIRGLTGFRTLMLIDGIRLNNSTFRDGPNQYWSTVDPFLADHIDIIRGPSSVLYGSDAMGGTAYLHTISPDVDAAGVNVRGRSITRYASAEHSLTQRGEVSGNADGFGWLIGGTYRDMGEVDGGSHYGRMENSDYNEYGADAKFVLKTGEHGRVILAGQHFRQNEASRWHRTVDSRSWHGTLPGTDLEDDFDQERNLYYLQYQWDSQGGIIDKLRSGVSFQRQGEDEDRVLGTGVRQYSAFVVETYGAFLQAGKSTPLGYFTAGVEYYYDNVNSSRHDTSAAGVVTSYDRGPIADEADYGTLGIYLQDEIHLGRLDITPGVRFTRATVDAKEIDPFPGLGADVPGLHDSYQAVTGSLRLLYHVTDEWNVIAGWGQGFRAPGLDDTTSARFVQSGQQEIPATDLDPEYSHTFDLGVRTRYSWVEFSAFGFYTILRDFIQRYEVGDQNGDGISDFGKDNFSDGWIYGYEVAGRVKVHDNVWLFADWGYAKGESDQIRANGELTEQPLPKMNASTLHVGLRYEHKASRVWIEGLYTAVARQSHLALSEGADGQRIPQKHGTPGYTVYTIRGGVQVCDNLGLTLTVENLSNKDYRVHGSGQNEPGTNAILGMDVKF